MVKVYKYIYKKMESLYRVFFLDILVEQKRLWRHLGCIGVYMGEWNRIEIIENGEIHVLHQAVPVSDIATAKIKIPAPCFYALTCAFTRGSIKEFHLKEGSF